jgi:hypothetical protein
LFALVDLHDASTPEALLCAFNVRFVREIRLGPDLPYWYKSVLLNDYQPILQLFMPASPADRSDRYHLQAWTKMFG